MFRDPAPDAAAGRARPLGRGYGRRSLVYANTLYEPLDAFWHDPQWAGIADWREELVAHYATARRMLGAATVPFETPADRVLAHLAEWLGVAETYRPTDVAVHFGEPGVEVPDPYFGGAGPPRSGCRRCGGCMVGCRHGAKNTLDRNYLWLAERAGAEVFPEREAVDLVPRMEGGWEVVARRPGRGPHPEERFGAGQVVVAAGVLGTLRLLFRAQERGHLPGISPRLGEAVRTNSEAIVGATARADDVDYSEGVAIGSSIFPNEHTHIEPVRYPKGSNAMGLLGTLLVDGGGRAPRQLRLLAEIARHPVLFLRSLSVRRWSERTVILLVMQSRAGSLRVRWQRGRLTSEQGDGEPNPTYIPEANEAARIVAELIGGHAGSSVNEVLLDAPMTARILGGCCIGETAERGVVDPWLRVHDCPGLHVVDGSAVSANLGANPSLTITAQAERALSFWPNRGEADPRPPSGAPYELVEPVAARDPAVV